MKAATLSYLPHLDGLRALAFTYVLLFHFRVFGAVGGYLGVDIFLVLSGFLMTRIILRDVAAGTFSMVRFMTRRFWRLYPTLLATASATLLASIFLYTSRLVKEVSKSTTAALLFGSNIYFQMTTGYFDVSTELKPLLHTWSLSLEEQFYFVWPVFLFIVYRTIGKRKDGLTAALACATLASLYYAWHMGKRDATFAFFALPTRIFEFTVGGLLSVHYDTLAAAFDSGPAPDLAAVLGAVLVNYPVFYPGKSHMPGFASFPTLLGTSLLIVTPRSALSRRVLTSPLARWVGKLSYSGYLVHWPIWVYALFVFDTTGVGAVSKPAMFLATFALAYVLHHGVENAFRHKRSALKSGAVFAALGLTLLLAAGALDTNGYSDARLIPSWAGMYRSAGRYQERKCDPLPDEHPIFKPLGGKKPPRHCYIGPSRHALPLPLTAVVAGSSFAGHLKPALRLLSLQRNMSFLVLYRPACPLFPDFDHVSFRYTFPECREANRRRMPVIRALPPTHVVLCDHWKVRFGYLGLDGEKQRAFTYFRGAARVLQGIGHNVSVVVDPPTFGERAFRAVRACMMLRNMRRVIFGFAPKCRTWLPRPLMHSRMNARYKKFFNTDKSMRKVKHLHLFPKFCPADAPKKCVIELHRQRLIVPPGVLKKEIPDTLLFWEGAHLNIQGSWFVSPEVGAFLESNSR